MTKPGYHMLNRKNRLHPLFLQNNAVIAVLNIVHAIVCSEGPIGRHLKNAGAYNFEVNFSQTLKTLSEKERLRLGTENGVAWLRGQTERRAYAAMVET